MTTLADLDSVPLSGLIHIDALLMQGRTQWNYLTGEVPNTITYTFSLDGYTPASNEHEENTAEFSTVQREAALQALDEAASVTGIRFVETASGDALVHFARADLDENVAGRAYRGAHWSYTGDTITDYTPHGTIYLDNYAVNDAPAPGSYGYQTLLHEIGHVLGLKHPFDGDIVLPEETDNWAYTVMSYTSSHHYYSEYNQYDVAALYWLYGGDGLGGRYGVDAQGRYLVGTSAADVLTATAGDDLLFGAAGNDTMDGGAGIDRLMSNAAVEAVHIERTASGYTVTGPDGIDTLVNVERAQFGQRMFALDIDGNGGAAYRLYQAAFDRQPDAIGLGYWIGVLDDGASLRDAAAGFIASDEFARLYNGTPDNATLVDSLYHNILHRAPEQAGYDYWLAALNQGGDRAEVLVQFSESGENKATVAAIIGNGFEYTPYA